MKRFAILLVLAGCGLDNSLVGGECREGYEPFGHACIASTPSSPPSVVPPFADSSAPDAGSDSSVDVDAGEPDSGRAVTHLTTDDETVPGIVFCEPGYTACGQTCESLADDGHNCGACGKICPSNICIAGECMGAMAGDVVLVGHDFAGAWDGSAQAKVLANAISIPTTNPIRVLSYEDDADPTAVAQARQLMIDGVHGRSVEITRASKADLDSMSLALSYDVVVLHDAGDASLGLRWKNSLPHFTAKGGVVVALDGGASHMSELVSSSTLLGVSGHAKLAEGTHLLVSMSGDVIGTQVLSPYAAFGPPVAFSGVESGPDVSWVVRVDDPGAAPVVVHKTVKSPN